MSHSIFSTQERTNDDSSFATPNESTICSSSSVTVNAAIYTVVGQILKQFHFYTNFYCTPIFASISVRYGQFRYRVFTHMVNIKVFISDCVYLCSSEDFWENIWPRIFEPLWTFVYKAIFLIWIHPTVIWFITEGNDVTGVHTKPVSVHMFTKAWRKL